MQLAQCDAVGNDRLTAWLPVRNDVGGIKQLLVPELAQRASPSVRRQHTLAEPGLMQTLLDDMKGIGPSRVLLDRQLWQAHAVARLEGNLKGQVTSVVTDDEGRPDDEV